MAEVSSSEVSANFGTYREIADGSRGTPDPVFVTHYDRPSVVILATEEYERLKKRDRRVMATEDLPEWLARQISGSEMEAQFACLDEAG